MNTLHTPRLTLLPQCAAHADAMFVVLGDPAIYAYENEAPASVEWLRARFARLESRRSADGREHWLNWVVCPVDDGAPIGYVQATVRADGCAYIAYVFGSAHWGRGLAGEATAAVLDELAAHYPVSDFLAVLKRANGRSLRLLERLGFAPAAAAVLAANPVKPDELLMTLTVKSSKDR
jgi:RimJ/RimL family protein N-acetyltransferase